MLVAPLNWGLGHATRCVPLIKKAHEQGFRVVLASDGAAGVLLKNEFPQLIYLELPSYNMRYPFDSILLNVFFLLPKILMAIVSEFFFIKNIVEQYQIDAIIADNRYGVFSRKKTVKNIFLGHQLNIKISNIKSDEKNEKLSFLEKIIAAMQYFYLNMFFHAIAVPDAPSETENLAGNLCHGGFWQKKTHLIYIGVQSRFSRLIYLNNKQKKQDFESSVIDAKINAFAEKTPENLPKKVLILLSGLEPQRSILEKMILSQVQAIAGFDFTLVRGVPQKEVVEEKINANIRLISHLYTNDLFEKIAESEIIICRSGYSTLMDLSFFVEKKLILIPTPGQTEQIYLAHRLARKKQCVLQIQNHLNLQNALNALGNIDFFEQKNTENALDELLDYCVSD